MPLKVIGAGFGRTGTSSLCAALNQLDFPCYHMFEVLHNPDNKSHMDFWRKVANSEPGSQHDWEQVFARYTAAVDNPAAPLWRELMAAYPDAKVILTLHPRGPEVWYESVINTIYFTETLWAFKVLKLFTPFGRKMGEMCHKLIWQRFHKGTMANRGEAIAYYQKHIDVVKDSVPADKLLVFSVDQGWKPLCDFLGVPVPDSEFPNINDRAQFQKVIREITRGGYIISTILAALLAALAYGAFRLLS